VGDAKVGEEDEAGDATEETEGEGGEDIGARRKTRNDWGGWEGDRDRLSLSVACGAASRWRRSENKNKFCVFRTYQISYHRAAVTEKSETPDDDTRETPRVHD
jgi:hypothetical protein